VVHSTDPQVLGAAGQLAMLSSVSADTQVLLRDLIADAGFVEAFERERTARLADAYAGTAKALNEHGIGYVPAAAGLFVWMDLRRFLDEPTYDAENRLWQRIFDTARVNISPDAAFRCSEPGWFRLCFASPAAAVLAGVERLARAL
jgi:bifunctional pyridoxal-dependent enzyme with beta-cystathionase and maltose regulon repressor activities